MKKEKAVLSFIAIFIGLVVAGIAFYVYQLTKTLPPQKTRTEAIQTPTKTPKSAMFLSISEPNDEIVATGKVIKITGKTDGNAVVVIATKLNQEVVKPTSEGDFSTTVNIDDGVNLIKITAIASDGQQQTISRTVSYTTEDF